MPMSVAGSGANTPVVMESPVHTPMHGPMRIGKYTLARETDPKDVGSDPGRTTIHVSIQNK